MVSRDLVVRSLNHQPIERIPRDLWHVPGIEMFREDELAEIRLRYPSDIVAPDFTYPPGERSQGSPYTDDRYTDAWGCIWHVAQSGMIGEVKQSPLADAAEIGAYRPPWELLEQIDLDRINRGCAATSRFVLAKTETRPFERLQFLRGTEATFLDLASGSKRVRSLLDMLHEFFCRELEIWAGSDIDGVMFMDDWGSQDSLLIAPEMWRDLFRPLYRDYCEILHAQDKFAFFHSDGNISDIFEDLVHLGIDAINSQLFVMDIERLAESFRGQVTFWGEIDRQRVLPFGTSDDIARCVRRVRKALDFGRGGLIAQCEWDMNVSRESIAEVFDQWMAPLPMHVM